MRESDGVHFFWNGDHPVRVSPDTNEMWHHNHGELPYTEKLILDRILDTKRIFIFTIPSYGRYRVVTRGEFAE